MVPLACVELPAFPLQLLLRHRPEWAHYPAAVVAEDKPQGLILWVNERARQHGVLPGLRYAAALSLAAELRASEVSPNEIRKAVKELTERLMRYTPEVEPAAEEPGVFWLNGMGLKFLYPSSNQWAPRPSCRYRSAEISGQRGGGLHALRDLCGRQSNKGE